MRVVFFGAGASYGSEPSAPVPPLGSDLFDALAKFAPLTWGAVPDPWPARFRADFESAMVGFIDAGGFGAPLQWDMAEFFYRLFSATTASAYVDLLQHLAARMKDLQFVTLN